MKIEAIGGKGPGGCETATCGVDQDILMQCDPRLIFPPGSANICARCSTECKRRRRTDALRVMWHTVPCGLRAVFDIRPEQLGMVLPERRRGHPAGYMHVFHDS